MISSYCTMSLARVYGRNWKNCVWEGMLQLLTGGHVSNQPWLLFKKKSIHKISEAVLFVKASLSFPNDIGSIEENAQVLANPFQHTLRPPSWKLRWIVNPQPFQKWAPPHWGYLQSCCILLNIPHLAQRTARSDGQLCPWSMTSLEYWIQCRR